MTTYEQFFALSDLLLVPHLSQTFLPLVSCHLVTFAFFSAGHRRRPPSGYGWIVEC